MKIYSRKLPKPTPVQLTKYEKLGYSSYSDFTMDYSKDSPWSITKERFRRMYPNRSVYCWICMETSRLQLHHRSYVRLGAEDIKRDIVMLCNIHHKGKEGVHYQPDGQPTPKFYKPMLKREKELRRQYVLKNLRPTTIWKFLSEYIYRLQK